MAGIADRGWAAGYHGTSLTNTSSWSSERRDMYLDWVVKGKTHKRNYLEMREQKIAEERSRVGGARTSSCSFFQKEDPE